VVHPVHGHAVFGLELPVAAGRDGHPLTLCSLQVLHFTFESALSRTNPAVQVVWWVGHGGGDLAGGEERRPGAVRLQAHFHIKLGAVV